MKDQVSKSKNLIKKYGLKNTCLKIVKYLYSNYLVRFSLLENLTIALQKKKIKSEIRQLLAKEQCKRIVVWRSVFGWDVPLYQRPQHIFSNFAKQDTLVFYEVTRFTDSVKRMEKKFDHLYLVNFNNQAFSKLLLEAIEQQDKPYFVQLYSTDWNMSCAELKSYISRGYKVIYEYIDDLNPALAGTDELPKNVKEKYEYVMSHEEAYVVVTADALKRDVISKRGEKNLIFSCNGVDYDHFHNQIDEQYVLDDTFLKVLSLGKPVIGYYGALAKWVDYELLRKIAQTNLYEIVLFGIKYDDSMEQSGIQGCEHIHFLGAKRYEVLQNYASKFDVLTIPFLINDITKATSPVKLFEYMAMNIPIVTTDMDECRKYESVLIGKTHEEFLEKLQEALVKKKDASYIQCLNREALENTWYEKAKLILEGIEA